MSATRSAYPLLLGAAGLFALVMVFAPAPQKKQFIPTMLFANPLFYKGSSGYFHTLLADRLWLQSNSIGEMSRQDATDEDSFAHAFKTIAVMDPHFFTAISYGALYLASMKDRIDLAVEILDTGLESDSENFDLMMLKLSLIVSYETPMDYEKIRTLAQQTARLAEKRNQVREGIALEFVESVLTHAAQQTNRTQEIYQDLIWLYKSTENPERKEKIKKRIEELYGNQQGDIP